LIKKRALVVDDSKSARFVLKRMLDQLQLEVDMVESAIDAIKYLEQHKPDIIFMDHMMPGMDGFEAVKHIKDNAQTAAIPIMMYTSKGGDVYLSQARALGAVGIIRKTIAPVELRESLLELGLIKDVPVKSSIKLANTEIEAPTPNADNSQIQPPTATENRAIELYIRDLHRLMDDQTIELHRSMWLGIESVGNEIFNRLNSELVEKIENIQSELQQNNARHKPFYSSKGFWSFFIVCILLMISLSYNFSHRQTDNTINKSPVETTTSINSPSQAQHKQVIEHAPSPSILDDNNQLAREAFNKWATDATILYPYDEVALNDKRQPFAEELINKAKQANYKGLIILQTHVGEFCLNSDYNGNYKLAEDDTRLADCDIIGNIMQLDDRPSSHQSLSFVNYFSDSEALNQQGIFVEVRSLNRKTAIVDYPDRTIQTTAANWNQAAQQNNRITIKLLPENLN